MKKGDKVLYENEVYTYDKFSSSGSYEDRDIETWRTIIDKHGVYHDIKYPDLTNVISVEILKIDIADIEKEIKELIDKKNKFKEDLLLLQQ